MLGSQRVHAGILGLALREQIVHTWRWHQALPPHAFLNIVAEEHQLLGAMPYAAWVAAEYCS
jgi:hypothetical protein